MTTKKQPSKPRTYANKKAGRGCPGASCSGSSDITEKRRKQNLQNNSPLQDKGLLRVIFANEAKTKGTAIYQKTNLIQ